MSEDMKAVHDKVENLIEKCCTLAVNMSRLSRISPKSALHGLDVIEANIDIVNEAVGKLVQLK